MKRLLALDILKGVAILAVIFYHAGLLHYGYLGVEVFLVIGGYLTTKSIIYSYDKRGKVDYWNFIGKRLVRLWPLALLISLISLVIGYFVMLPTSLKNTSETVLGTSTFVNNFIQCITSSDYWDQSNDYKPLMHTWYIGLIFQFYVLFPILFIITHRLCTDWKRAITILLWCILGISLGLYILPLFTTAQKFYLLPARLYEFVLGGLVAISANRYKKIFKINTIFSIGFTIIIFLFIISPNLEIDQIRLLVVVFVTTLLIMFVEIQCGKNGSEELAFIDRIKTIKIIAYLGMASYSLYLWHQVILALYRNTVEDDLSVWAFIFLLSLSLGIGLFSYKYIESPLSSFVSKSVKHRNSIIYISLLISIALVFVSIKIYIHHGVVRDIPELDIYVHDPNTWETQEYNDAIKFYDEDFPANEKKNVLVIGDSYARDWANVLLESGNKKMNLSYHARNDSIVINRIKEADYVFVANHGPFDQYYSLLPFMMTKKFYRIGHKYFGTKNGIIYNTDRYGSNYYSQKEKAIIYDFENDEKAVFGDQYIDIMSLIKDKQGMIPVFTPERKMYSHDGLHLTRAGAKAMAKLIAKRYSLLDSI